MTLGVECVGTVGADASDTQIANSYTDTGGQRNSGAECQLRDCRGVLIVSGDKGVLFLLLRSCVAVCS